MCSLLLGIRVRYKEIVLKDTDSSLVMNIMVHEFLNKDTWELHLTLQVNNTLVGIASAKTGRSSRDYETVVAAMQSLKNDYYVAIGSPMRYSEGKLVYLPADEGLASKRTNTAPLISANRVQTSDQMMALSH